MSTQKQRKPADCHPHTYHHTNTIMYINIKSQVVQRRIQQRRCDLTRFGKQILRYGKTRKRMISNSARASLGMASQTVCNSDSGAAMGRSLVTDACSHRINANGKDTLHLNMIMLHVVLHLAYITKRGISALLHATVKKLFLFISIWIIAQLHTIPYIKHDSSSLD